MSDVLSNIWERASSGMGAFSAILDLIIVFYLVYITLLLIRGTRTVPMALGLLLIVVLYLVSSYFGLATTYMLLDQFMEVAVIFALIIFQDDIRRALVRMGRFAWFSKAQESQIVEEVIKAAAAMASKRIGAIIVFERDASLSEFTEEGTKLDSTVTKELLYTIFIPRMENPLHDGATIIKNYRVSEAGVLLPLSSNTHLDKTLGTRHRAALGVTEQTDAVSVVVSEERGTISLCFGGRMSKNLDAASLRKALHGLFSKEKIKERKKAAEERKTKAMRRPSTIPASYVEEKGEKLAGQEPSSSVPALQVVKPEERYKEDEKETKVQRLSEAQIALAEEIESENNDDEDSAEHEAASASQQASASNRKGGD